MKTDKEIHEDIESEIDKMMFTVDIIIYTGIVVLFIFGCGFYNLMK